MSDIRYSTLAASFMNVLTTMAPRTETFANSLEKLQHFAPPNILQSQADSALQELYPCIH